MAAAEEAVSSDGTTQYVYSATIAVDIAMKVIRK